MRIDFNAIIQGVYPEGIPREDCLKFCVLQKKVDLIKAKIALVKGMSPTPMPDKLEEHHLPKKVGSSRRWIVLTYNRLKYNDHLAVLDLPIEELFEHKGGHAFQSHDLLILLASAFMKGAYVGEMSFDCVLRDTKVLKETGLSGYKCKVLEEHLDHREKELQFMKESMNSLLEANVANQTWVQTLS